MIQFETETRIGYTQETIEQVIFHVQIFNILNGEMGDRQIVAPTSFARLIFRTVLTFHSAYTTYSKQ